MKIRFLLVLLLANLFVYAQKSKPANKKPNIIFILADDLGYGDLSCYGQKRFTTPNIDQLAKEGIRFTQAYAGTAVCAPSRSALLTGLHTGHTPIRGNYEIRPEGQLPMPDSVTLVSQLMKSAGYTTGCFGKWGLGFPGSVGDPVNKGFDDFFGYNCQRLAHNYYPYHLWHNKEKVELPENSGNKAGTYAPELIHKQAIKFIEDNKNKPFVMFYTTTVPHAEVAAPSKYLDPEIGKYGPETAFIGPDTTVKGFTKDGAYTTQKNPHAGYAAMIRYLDDKVGEIVKKLKVLGLDKNTIIIFSSDNGPSIEGGEDPAYFNSSGSLRGHKRDLYEGGIREPMIVRWPDHIRSGVTDQKVAFWDMLPTFADLADQKVPFKTDGISIKPTLLGTGTQQQHPYLYWEFHEMGGSMALRVSDWKAIRKSVAANMNGPIELYDLKTDPAEQRNVAAANPEVIKKMEDLFKTARVPSAVFNFIPIKKQL